MVLPPVSQDQFQHLATVVGLVWWTFTFGLIFLMQLGFMWLEAGSIQGKNAANVGMKVMLHTGICLLAFYLIGFAIKGFAWPLDAHDWLANAGSWWPWDFHASPDLYLYAFLGSAMFALTSMAIPGTVLSERFSLKAYMLFSLVFSAFIYPVFGWLIWGGVSGSPLLDPHQPFLQALDTWLTPAVHSPLGQRLLAYGMTPDATGLHFWAPYTDYAGSTGVHVLGALVGLVGTVMIGPRLIKFGPDGQARHIRPHNIPMAVMGAMLLAFCWLGFNGGSAAANYLPGAGALAGVPAGPRGLYLVDFLFSDVWWVVIVTFIAAAGGIIGSMLASMQRGKGVTDPLDVVNGMLGALVAICAGVGFVHPLYGFVIGFVAGFQFPYTFAWLERRFKIDDPIGTISCHGVSGMIGSLMAGIWGQLFWWGLLPAGWVHPGGALVGGTSIPTLAIQLVGMAAVVVWTVPVSWAAFKLIDRATPLRISETEELQGLDLANHGREAYVNVEMPLEALKMFSVEDNA